MLKPTLAALALCIPLAACQTTKLDNVLQSNLPQTCELLETAHVAFVAIATTGQVPASTVRKEAAAYAGVEIICTDPANVTATSAIVRVAAAYAVVVLALKEASE